MKTSSQSPFRRLLFCLSLLATIGLVAPARMGVAAKGSLIEKTIEVPRDHRLPVDITYEKVTILDVESRNDPKQDDLNEAERKDPKDHTLLVIRFRYKNDDYTKARVHLRAILLDDDGRIIGDGGRAGSLDPQKKDDTFSFPVRIKTLDWPLATKMKIIATFKD